MRLRLMSLLVILSIFVSYSNAQETIQKKYCMSSIGYQGTSDELRAELLMEAKRLAVGEFFGEFISSYTKVEMFTLTEDRIVASSAGFVRIKGSPKFISGESFGEVCVVIDAYVTQEDIDKFRAVTINKRHCVSEPNLTARQLKKHAKEEAIIAALLDYDRKLEARDKTELLPLVRNIKYLESGFIPGTESYCVTFEGVIYPIEIFALEVEPIRKVDKTPKEKITEESVKKPVEKKVIKAGEIFFKEEFYKYDEGDPIPSWGEGLMVKKGRSGSKYLTSIIPGTHLAKQYVNFPENFQFEYTWSAYDDRNSGRTAPYIRVLLKFYDEEGKVFKVECGNWGVILPGLPAKDFSESGINSFKLTKKGNAIKVYNNGAFLLSGVYPDYSKFVKFEITVPVKGNGEGQLFTNFVGTSLGE